MILDKTEGWQKELTVFLRDDFDGRLFLDDLTFDIQRGIMENQAAERYFEMEYERGADDIKTENYEAGYEAGFSASHNELDGKNDRDD